MTKTIKLAKELSLPIDAVTQKLAWLGRTGSGKTYGAKRMVEEMLRAGAQVVILDPVGVWAGLRLGPKSFDVPVLGGLHGDIPLEPTAGAIVADLVVDHGTSMVLDVSQMLDAQRTRFAAAFGGQFFQRKKAAPAAVHLLLEECQDFVPQNYQSGEEQMLHEFQRIAKQGRSFGIGLSLVSQRPQEVNKKALNQAECVLAFQMTGPQERKALEYWLSDKGFEGKLSDILPRLDVGAPHVWSPQWLKISKVVHILPIDSLDTSSTPKVGEKAFKQRKLKPIDLKALSASMAETIERAKADDPKELRKRIAELEARNLEHMRNAAKAIAEVERVEVPVFHETSFDGMFGNVLGQLDGLQQTVAAAKELVRREMVDWREGVRTDIKERRTVPRRHDRNPLVGGTVPVPKRAPAPPKLAIKPNGAGMGKCARSILTALVQHGALSLVQAAIIAGYAPDSGGTRNAAGELRAGGYAAGSNDRLEALPAGRAAVADAPRLPTGAALAEYWYGKLGKAEAYILKVAVDAYPDRVALTDAAKQCGYAPDSGGVRNAAGRLRTLALVHGGNGGMIADERLV